MHEQIIRKTLGLGDWNTVSSDSSDSKKCLHESCPDCQGTGYKKDGSLCIHYISCPCPKCITTY